MSEHTKGRLVAEKGLFSWVVRWDFGARGIWCDDLEEDDARRLAACWNALEGIDQETLDMGWTGMGCMESAHKHEDRAATFAKDIEILAKKLVDMTLTRVEMEKQHTNLLLAYHSASSELNAARALLREVLKADDDAIAELSALGLPPDGTFALTDRIRSYLDACDTLGDGNG